MRASTFTSTCIRIHMHMHAAYNTVLFPPAGCGTSAAPPHASPGFQPALKCGTGQVGRLALLKPNAGVSSTYTCTRRSRACIPPHMHTQMCMCTRVLCAHACYMHAVAHALFSMRSHNHHQTHTSNFLVHALGTSPLWHECTHPILSMRCRALARMMHATVESLLRNSCTSTVKHDCARA